MTNETAFDVMRIGLATTEQIRKWSHGEVKKPETINYRTLKPEKDGLFCEKIFGPSKDWECNCGKYKRVRYKGIVCERCGVEVTRSKVRRDRMGHLELSAPVTHIWYFKGVPSRLGYLLDLAPKDLEKIIYFAAYMIISIDEESRKRDMPNLANEISLERENIYKSMEISLAERRNKLENDLATLDKEGAKSEAKRKLRDIAQRDLSAIRKQSEQAAERLNNAWEKFQSIKVNDLIGDEVSFRELKERFGSYFVGAMGAEAIQKRLRAFDLKSEAEDLREQIKIGKGQRKTRALKRLKVITAFLVNNNKPESMVLEVIPVIPPDLRPMVQLDGGRFATSDLNDLYRRVINRNNRLKRLKDLGAPEIIINNEKRMLQEAVDNLFDNGRRGRPVTGPGNRALKSLSDMLKGKQGRFRQNLLGKRVDYSGRSVIVVGPQLKLHQCGLPKQMALELFKPFVMKRLVDLNHAQNIKSAKRMVERYHPAVWDVLEEIITEHPVLLNRAPTLHRLGIQAFEPQLVEGKAIQLHPLVCSAFNADFDGDQMAVHLPLSPEAQAEARLLMLSSSNILKPSDGRPAAVPTQDMIVGVYHLTTKLPGAQGEGLLFGSVAEAIMAYDLGKLHMQAKCKIKINKSNSDGKILETSLGQVIFNETLPEDYPWVEKVADKSTLSSIVNDLAERYPKIVVAHTLDNMKNAGFFWASRSGVTIAISDVIAPIRKTEILENYEIKALKVQRQYDKGLISDEERRQELVEIWSEATDKVSDAMKDSLQELNPINRMVLSGARGNWMQIRQIAGMRGLVANPKGEIIPRPIKSSYLEGLSVLEYFIATHGARKGLADTALRTANSGYLTRRLVDVSQDVIVREEDCGTIAGLTLPIVTRNENGDVIMHEDVENSVYSRTLAQDVNKGSKTLAKAGDDVGDILIEKLFRAGITEVKIRSVLTCESRIGTCANCYGRSLASGKLVDIGEAVGIIAAQSIGEPGTQLTMRTFHTGGAVSSAGEDITQGLPRIQELFEARTPKGVAPIAEYDGQIKIEEYERSMKLILIPNDGFEEMSYSVPRRSLLMVKDGQSVKAGQQLMQGAIDPKQILRILGPRAAQKHLVDEVQNVYRSQGVGIHDKHVEVIVRQMLRRVTIIDSGDTSLLPGELTERVKLNDENLKAIHENKQPASGRPELMGITKASLATESWLSAASFQETTRVLTQAAMESKSDPLLGLKENVIIGKLIPAGTGLSQYQNMVVVPTEEARQQSFAHTSFEELQTKNNPGKSIPLEDYDLGANFQ